MGEEGLGLPVPPIAWSLPLDDAGTTVCVARLADAMLSEKDRLDLGAYRYLVARTGTKAAVALAAAHREDATSEMLTSLQFWWAEHARRAGLSGNWLVPGHAVSGVEPAFVRGLDSPDLHDRSGHELGQAYVQTLSPSSRAQHGQHYTPADLADHLWSQTRTALGWNLEDHRLPGLLREPAAGSGALLLPPLREHLRAAASDDAALTLAALPQLIEGIDQDGVAAW